MKPIIKAYMTVYGVSEDEAWTAYESMSPSQYHDVMRLYNSGYTAQEAPQTAPAAEAEQQTTETTTTAEEATAAGIIRRNGGYRERELLNHPHEMIHSETWNEAHKVIEILATTPDPDGYRPGCAVDIVTRSIVG